MMRRMMAGAVLVLIALDALAGKKYVSVGWEYRNATPAQLLANADKLKDTALDGVGIYPCATNAAGEEMKFVSRGAKWEREPFLPQIPVLRKLTAHPNFRESFFIGFGAPKKRLDWSDDAAWANLANSMAVLAWLSKESGVRGQWCDHEDYYGQKQFAWREGDPPYDELVAIARRRGAEVFGAAFREHPDIRFLFCWFLTFERDYFAVREPLELVKERKDLWPAFVNGILDVLPPEARIIDGDEHAYRADYATRDFHVSAANQKLLAAKLIVPENRLKYAMQVQVGFGLYLDMYVFPKGNFWYFGPVNGSRLEHFRRNLADATFLADEYVWLWGEHNVTVHWDGIRLDDRVDGRDKTWDEAVPGLYAMMKGIREKDGGLARRKAYLRSRGELRDLNPNPACRADGHVPLPRPYATWHSAKDRSAQFLLDDSAGCGDRTSVAMRMSATGSIFMDFPEMQPGDVYCVDVKAKGRRPMGRVSWKANGTWAQGKPDFSIAFGEAGKDGWRSAETYVTVPPGADTMAVILNAAPQRSAADGVNFDDIHVYRIY